MTDIPSATDPESADRRAARLLTASALWMPDHFTESAWVDHAPFAFWIIEAHRPRVLVELGTHHGFSYLAFCQAVERLATGTRCYAVDTWRGDVHVGQYGDEVLAPLREYHDPRYGSFSELLRTTFEEAAHHFPDDSVDLLHIDGTHLLETVQADFATWLPKMSSRGVILFHDINVHRSSFGVFAVWEALKGRYPHFEFDHGHGLGVLAVGKDASRSLGPLLEASRDPELAIAVRRAFARLGAGVLDHQLALAAPEARRLAAELADRARQLEEERDQLVGRLDLTDRLLERTAQSDDRVERVEARLGDLAAKVADTHESIEDARLIAERAAALEAKLVAVKGESTGWKQRAQTLEREKQQMSRQVAELGRSVQELESSVTELRTSTSWRVTAPIRTAVRGLGRVKRFARRGAKVVWWTVTLQLPRRLRARRAVAAPGAPAASGPTVRTNAYTETRRFTEPGPGFEEFEPAPAGTPQARMIAFYLPQFHAVPENDAWWGRGFTEWRNLARGVPRFADHYQPRIPRDIGFYDLNDSAVMRRQADLARAAGIEGFCFYYYRFDSGRLLEGPVERFLADQTIEMPFCLIWANENWTRTWDGFDRDVLAAQSYDPGLEDGLIADLVRHFADARYIRVDGRPLLFIYRPGLIPDTVDTVQRWRTRFEKDHGENPLILMAQGFGDTDPRLFGLDGAVEFPPHKLAEGLPRVNDTLKILDPDFAGEVRRYSDLIRSAREVSDPGYPLIRTVVPSWDNEARRPGRGYTFAGSSPLIYRSWLDDAIAFANRHPFHGEPFVFVNAWNEWAEAAYLEPDVHYGSAYLNATARALHGITEPGARTSVLLVGHDARRHGAQMLLLNLGRLLARRFGAQVEFLLHEGGELRAEYEQTGRVTVLPHGAPQLHGLLLGLRERGFDKAITNTVVTGGVVPALRDAGLHVISLVHEMPDIITARGWEDRAAMLADSSDAIVFASRIVRDRFVEAFPAAAEGERVRIRAQGIYQRLAEVPELIATRDRLRREHGWGGDTTVVIGVGFGDARKGLDRFLAAAVLADDIAPHLRFVWVGDAESGMDSWLAQAPRTPRGFLHVPFTPDVLDWYAAADVLFVSSREDPYPSIVLEAIAAGIPSVAYRGATGAEELFGTDGVVVESPTPEAAVEVLRGIAPLSPDDRASRTERMRTGLMATHGFDDYGFDLLAMLMPGLRRVSVVVPNFNYAHYLPQRLSTVFGQGYPVFEVIVLDDASTDDSLRVIEDTARAAKRDITVVPATANSGSVFAQWRRGVGMARGEYVWIAEADDAADPSFLGELLRHCGPDTVLAFADSQAIGADGAVLGTSYQAYYATIPGGDLLRTSLEMDGAEFVSRSLTVANVILNVSAGVLRRADLAEVLETEREALAGYKFAGDWHVYAHLLPRGRVTFRARSLNSHRRHAAGATISSEAVPHVDEIARVHAELARVVPIDDALRALQEEYRSQVLASLTKKKGR